MGTMVNVTTVLLLNAAVIPSLELPGQFARKVTLHHWY